MRTRGLSAPGKRAALSGYLRSAVSAGRDTQRFRFEVVVCRATGLHPSQGSEVWVEIERGGRVECTAKVEVDAQGCAKWNEMLVLEKSMVPRSGGSFEPKPCKVKLKEHKRSEHAEGAGKAHKLSATEVDLASWIGDAKSTNRVLDLPVGTGASVALHLTVTSYSVSMRQGSGRESSSEGDGLTPRAVELPNNVIQALESIPASPSVRNVLARAVPSSHDVAMQAEFTQQVLSDELRLVEDQLLSASRRHKALEAQHLQQERRTKQLEADHHSLASQVAQLTQELERAQQEAENAQEQLDTERQQSQLQITQLASELELTAKREGELQTALESAQSQLEAAERERQEHKEAAEEARDKAKELERVVGVVRSLESELVTLRTNSEHQQEEQQHQHAVPASPFSDAPLVDVPDLEPMCPLPHDLPTVPLDGGVGSDKMGELEAMKARLAREVKKLRKETAALRLEAGDRDRELKTANKELAQARAIAEAREEALKKSISELHAQLAGGGSEGNPNANAKAEGEGEGPQGERRLAVGEEGGEELGRCEEMVKESLSEIEELRNKLAVAQAERDNAVRHLKELQDSTELLNAHVNAEQALLKRRVEEAEEELYRVTERKDRDVQDLKQCCAELDIQLVSCKAQVELGTKRLKEMVDDADALKSELALHTLPNNRSLQLWNTAAVHGATNVLKYYRTQHENLTELLAQRQQESEVLVAKVKRLHARVADLQLERHETFAQVDADQKIFNRRVKNLEAELHRCLSARDTLNKRTHDLRKERDRVTAQARADNTVTQGIINNLQRQLRQSRSLCDALREKYAQQQQQHQQKVQEMGREQEVLADQLKRIHEEYQDEELRLKRERDMAIQAARDLAANPSSASSKRGRYLSIRGWVDHLIPDLSVGAGGPLANGHRRVGSGETKRPPEEDDDEQDGGEEGAVGSGQQRRRTDPGVVAQASDEALPKLKLTGRSVVSSGGGGGGGGGVGHPKAGSAASLPSSEGGSGPLHLDAAMEEGHLNARLERALADKEELKTTLKQTVDHLATVIMQKERAFHELQERNEELEAQVRELGPSKRKGLSRASTAKAREHEGAPSDANVQRLVAALKADNEVLVSTSRLLGDHLCQVITEREDIVLRLSLERDELTAKLKSLASSRS